MTSHIKCTNHSSTEYFTQNIKEYIKYTSTHRKLYKIDHILGHKTDINKFRKLNNYSYTILAQCNKT